MRRWAYHREPLRSPKSVTHTHKIKNPNSKMSPNNQILFDGREFQVTDKQASSDRHETFLDLIHVCAEGDTGVGCVGDLGPPQEGGEELG